MQKVKVSTIAVLFLWQVVIPAQSETAGGGSSIKWLPSSVAVKPGVKLAGLNPKVVAAIPAVVETWRKCAPGIQIVITSGWEPTSFRKNLSSYHWKKQALDFRLRTLTQTQARCIEHSLAKNLPSFGGGRFDVVMHWELYGRSAWHLHLEWDDQTALQDEVPSNG